MRIYLDNCCYNRPYDKQNQNDINDEVIAIVEIQDKIRNNELELVTSFMLHYENGQKTNEKQKGEIENFFKTYRKFHIGIEFAEILAEPVRKIMSTGIKRKDAFHVASAIFSKCNYFITVDKRLLKFKTEKIKMMNPIDFIKEIEVKK